MSAAGPFQMRRWRLGAAIAIAVLVVALVAGALVFFSGGKDDAQAQMERIRSAVEESGVAADFEILPASTGEAGYSLDISLAEGAEAEATGGLLHTLYEEIAVVAKVDLAFAEEQTLSTTRVTRSESEWTELIEHVDGLGPVTATFSQVGPTGAATYWLDLVAEHESPADEYERLLSLERPDWLTYGHVQLTTAPDTWPSLVIDAGREVTEEELSTFRALDQELAATMAEGEQYELRMFVELGGESAQFEMRIVTQPLSHQGESDAPAPDDGSGDGAPEDAAPQPEATEESQPGPQPEAPETPQPEPESSQEPAPSQQEPEPAPRPDPDGAQQPDRGEEPWQDDSDSVETPNRGEEGAPGATPDQDSDTPDKSDPSVRIQAISERLSYRSELILLESGIDRAQLEISIDGSEPIVITNE